LGNDVVDDESELRLTLLDISELARLRWVATANKEVAPVELKPNRNDVRLPVGPDGR
jgi:hypothetical protein